MCAGPKGLFGRLRVRDLFSSPRGRVSSQAEYELDLNQTQGYQYYSQKPSAEGGNIQPQKAHFRL